MDGLECSEIMLSGVKFHRLRLDAEYYSKINLKLQSMIESIDGATIDSYGGTCDCSAFYPAITSYYSNDRSNIPFLRVNEIVDGLVTITGKTVFLPKKILDINSKTIAKAYPGDIIIAKGGNSLAKVGLVTDEFPEYATCRDVIILRTEKFNVVNPYYVWAFLHSKYGQTIMWRAASQTGQPHLTLPSISSIHIPHSLDLLSQKCEELYRTSTYLKDEAQAAYASAGALILSSIDYRPISQAANYAIKSFSESFGKTGRMDAEYYQPKYAEVCASLHTSDIFTFYHCK